MPVGLDLMSAGQTHEYGSQAGKNYHPFEMNEERKIVGA